MAIDPVTIILPIAITVLGGLAGYFGRIAQKYEDRRDDVYLKEIPGIYMSTLAFENSYNAYKEVGSFERLTNDMDKLSEILKNQVFSGNLLLYHRNLHKPTDLHKIMLEFYQKMDQLIVVLEEIRNEEDNSTKAYKKQIFLQACQNQEIVPYDDGLEFYPSEMLEKAKELHDALDTEFQRYRPFSWWLILVIIIIGGILGVIAILKTYT